MELASLLQHISVPLAVFDDQGVLVHTNSTWRTITDGLLPACTCVAGSQAKPFCPDCLLAAIPVDRRRQIRTELKRLLAGEQTALSMPLSLDRERKAVLQLRRLDAGPPPLFLAALYGPDLNLHLLEKAERLRTLINAMPDILCFKDGEGRWLETNDAGLELFRLQGVDYRGKKDSELAEVSPFFRQAFLICAASDEQAWAAGKLIRSEEIIPQPDGDARIFDIYKVPLFEPDGRRKGLMVLGRDITALKVAREKLERLSRQQQVIESLLLLSFQHRKLPELLDQALARIVRIPWLPFVAKGALFLADDDGEPLLHLVAEQGLDPESRQRCRQVSFDFCSCGTAAKERRIIFTSHLADSGRCPDKAAGRHGHYAVPILLKEELLGVLTLHVQPEHQTSEEETSFLSAVANTLALLIDRCRFQERLARSEANLAKAQRIAQLGYWEWDPVKDILRGSEELFRIVGIPPETKISGARFLRFVHPEDQKRREQTVRDALAAGTAYGITYRLLRPTDEIRIVHEEGEAVRGEDGRVRRLFGTLQDITLLKWSETQLALAAKVFESAIEGITVTDADGIILMVNRAFTKITGYSAEEAVGKRPNILKSDRHDEAFYQAMWTHLLAHGQWQGEIWNRRKNGEVYPEWLTITAIKDDTGQTTHYVAVFHDMSQLRSYEEQLHFHAYHDALTGLPNRLLLLDRLQVAIGHAHRSEGRLAVLFVDLDNFKYVNDSLGHAAGDLLLQQVAERFKKNMAEDCTVARLGGDDFAVLIEQFTDERQAVQVAERIIEFMAEPFNLRVYAVTATVSIGIALYPVDGRQAETLLKNAELAMYEAKEKGKNTYHLFTKALDAQVVQRLFLENSLRKAVERQEMIVYYQPKVALADGVIRGAEALVRWQRPDGNFASPAEFIPLAEETGLIIPLGENVLRQACEQAGSWLDAGHDLILSVNFSLRQFQQKDLPERVATILAETGFPAGNLEIEITETAVMANEEETVALMARLKQLGVRLALDDFGTGYSALHYLRKLPLDALKIDRSFVRDIPDDRDCMAIAAAILSLARDLRLAVVVEGVENEEQLAFFREHGAQEIQGFLFSPPVPAAEFAAMLASGRRLAGSDG